MSKASIQINLPLHLIHKYNSLQRSIDDGDLDGKGKEVGNPHITIKYGINKLDKEKIKNIVKKNFPFFITFGEIKSFPPSESSEWTSPLYIEVHAPALKQLHQDIMNNLDCIPDTFNEFVPHMTIAYVKPDCASKYSGKNIMDMQDFISKILTYSDEDRKETNFS